MRSAVRFTISDLESFPDTWDGTRYEIIDGELFVVHQPHTNHQRVVASATVVLAVWSEASGLGEVLPTPGLIFSDEDAVIPDLIWISHKRMERGLWDDGKIHVAPELVVEVLSPGTENVRRDREAKLKLYGMTGADEYWIIDWRARTVDIYRRQGESLALVETLTEEDTLTSPALPGFACAVGSLWRFQRR